jgi:hypothetical protein
MTSTESLCAFVFFFIERSTILSTTKKGDQEMRLFALLTLVISLVVLQVTVSGRAMRDWARVGVNLQDLAVLNRVGSMWTVWFV